MTRSPLLRACVALRLPRGLCCLRGEVPLADAEIRASLRKQHVATERLVLALADVLAGPDLALDEPVTDVWQLAAAVVKERDLPASMVGAWAKMISAIDAARSRPGPEAPAWTRTGRPCGEGGTLRIPSTV